MMILGKGEYLHVANSLNLGVKSFVIISPIFAKKESIP